MLSKWEIDQKNWSFFEEPFHVVNEFTTEKWSVTLKTRRRRIICNLEEFNWAADVHVPASVTRVVISRKHTLGID